MFSGEKGSAGTAAKYESFQPPEVFESEVFARSPAPRTAPTAVPDSVPEPQTKPKEPDFKKPAADEIMDDVWRPSTTTKKAKKKAKKMAKKKERRATEEHPSPWEAGSAMWEKMATPAEPPSVENADTSGEWGHLGCTEAPDTSVSQRFEEAAFKRPKRKHKAK